jgi:hypothetical protein
MRSMPLLTTVTLVVTVLVLEEAFNLLLMPLLQMTSDITNANFDHDEIDMEVSASLAACMLGQMVG